MKFTRIYSTTADPYGGIVFEPRTSRIVNPDGSVIFEAKDAMVPGTWTQVAIDVLAQKYFRKAGVPAALQRVPEGGVPEWLWRSIPDDAALAKLPREQQFGKETDARQVFNRLAGTWTYWGWKNDYFDSEADARIYYDEMRAMLARQIGAPNSPQWFNTGLHWAYGIAGPPQGHYYVDAKTEELTRSVNAYERPSPHACFIQSVGDDLVNEGGIMDLWVREARIFKFGSGTGSNFSSIRGEGERLSGGGTSSGLMSFLRVGDRAAGAIKSGGTTRRAAKMVVLDLDHPDIEEFIAWKVKEEQKVSDLVAGSISCEKHLNAIMAAAWDESVPESARLDPAFNPQLKKAMRSALNAGIPQANVQYALDFARQGYKKLEIETYDTNWDSKAYGTVSGQNSNNSVRIGNAFFKALDANGDWELKRRTDGRVAKTIPAADLWERIAVSAWQCADPGVQFDSTINEWHTCPADGRINASNPCVTGDTLIATTEGHRTAASLVGHRFEALVDGKPYASTEQGFFFTGVKPVRSIRFSDGESLRATLNHEVYACIFRNGSISRGWVAWGDLREGDLVRVHSHAVKVPAGAESNTINKFGNDYLAVVQFEDSAPEPVFDCTIPAVHVFDANGFYVHNCSEYLFLDDTACNLSSLNLVKFLNEGDGSFDAARFAEACRLWTFTLEISVLMAQFPAKVIAQKSYDYRTLGLGYANLGTMLMRLGLPYDSEEGFGWCAAISALMTGAAYRTSAEMAQQFGAFPRYAPNRDGMLRVIRNHRNAAHTVPADSYEGLSITPVTYAPTLFTQQTWQTARKMWDEALTIGEIHGFRNAQVTCIAPTGTIGLVMSCDTTGVEPDFALVKFKKLAGGGYFKISTNRSSRRSAASATATIRLPRSKRSPPGRTPSKARRTSTGRRSARRASTTPPSPRSKPRSRARSNCRSRSTSSSSAKPTASRNWASPKTSSTTSPSRSCATGSASRSSRSTKPPTSSAGA